MPSILDIDCFMMFINLHFSISTIFISLSSPYGYQAPLEDDPIILPLMGLTDAHLIKLTAAAHILQFLLTWSPVMEDQSCMCVSNILTWSPVMEDRSCVCVSNILTWSPVMEDRSCVCVSNILTWSPVMEDRSCVCVSNILTWSPVMEDQSCVCVSNILT